MARKQTRRSISVAGTTYAALKEYCEARSISMSGVVEECIKKKIGMLRGTHIDIPKSPTTPTAPTTPKIIGDRFFTF